MREVLLAPPGRGASGAVLQLAWAADGRRIVAADPPSYTPEIRTFLYKMPFYTGALVQNVFEILYKERPHATWPDMKRPYSVHTDAVIQHALPYKSLLFMLVYA